MDSYCPESNSRQRVGRGRTTVRRQEGNPTREGQVKSHLASFQIVHYLTPTGSSS